MCETYRIWELGQFPTPSLQYFSKNQCDTVTVFSSMILTVNYLSSYSIIVY